jgi:periplasmic protein TonB
MLVFETTPIEKRIELVCQPLDQLSENALLKNKKVEFISDLIALKNSRMNRDHEYSKLFLMIGLVISLAFVILAFEWKSYEQNDLVDLGAIKNDFNEILEIPQTEQAPPPPPQRIIAPIIKEVDNDQVIKEIELTIDVEAREDIAIEPLTTFDFTADAPVEKVEEIFDIVESSPEPVGGMSAFYNYIKDNLEYPARAARLDISGRVYVQFVVEKDGSITDVKVIKGLYDDCDEEAVRVIKGSPNWIPGKQRGNAVRVYQRLPISFILQN